MNQAKQRILIIEDERDLVMGLKDALGFEGYEVDAAETGWGGVAKAERFDPHLIILDLMLPDINGFQVCEEIRKRDAFTPILILSARSQENDIIRGLEAGADDYVTKPFSIGELLARVRAVFRRSETVRKKTQRTIVVGDVTVDVQNHTAVVRGGKTVTLGFYATAILAVLDDRCGDLVTRDEILDAVWGEESSPTNRTVDNFILKLRRVLEKNPADPKHILTVYGQGYRLVK